MSVMNNNKMAPVDFDQILTMVGERGRYQTFMFFVLCIPATVPLAFLTFSNLFTTAVPEHWCQADPQIRNLNMSESDLKFITVPHTEKQNGEKIFDACLMYDPSNQIYRDLLNNTSILDETWKRDFEKRKDQIGTKRCENGWKYDKTYYENTLITELDLVCENSWSPQTSTALFYFGSLFGNAFFGWVADRWGRRTSMLWMIFLEVFVSILTSFSKDFQSYLILRTIGGLFFPSLYQIPFILGIELMAPKHRPLAGMIICMMFALAMCLLSLLAYLLKDWFKLSLVTSVPFLLLYSYYWIIPESPRWLFSKGRLEEAEEVLEKMAKFNGITLPKKILHQLTERADMLSPLITDKNVAKINGFVESQKPETEENYDKSAEAKSDAWNVQTKKSDRNEIKSYYFGENNKKIDCFVEENSCNKNLVIESNILDVFHYPNVRRKFFLLTFVWIANAVVYNGLSYNVTNLGVNDFLAFFISAAIELPSNVIAWRLMDIWGRKWLLSITLAMGGFGCLSCMLVPEDQVWVTVAFAMIGKFGVAASFTVFYVFVGESFPTAIRSQAMAVSSLIASVGLLVFPYILQLGEYWRMLPMAVLGILALCGSLANLFLPDTLNMPMPQTLEDGENFGKGIKIFSKPRRRSAAC